MLVASREILTSDGWAPWPDWVLVSADAEPDRLAPGRQWISFEAEAAPPRGWQWALGDPVRNRAAWNKSIGKDIDGKAPEIDSPEPKTKEASIESLPEKPRYRAAQKLSGVKKKAGRIVF